MYSSLRAGQPLFQGFSSPSNNRQPASKEAGLYGPALAGQPLFEESFPTPPSRLNELEGRRDYTSESLFVNRFSELIFQHRFPVPANDWIYRDCPLSFQGCHEQYSVNTARLVTVIRLSPPYAYRPGKHVLFRQQVRALYPKLFLHRSSPRLDESYA